jgi:hypothetical protein
MGMESAYNDMDLTFKQQFSYDECLQYVWKKAMGTDDKELLVFLHTALDPENVNGVADGTKAFKYNFELSKALNYAVYDGFFEAIPSSPKNQIKDYISPNVFEYATTKYYDSGWKNYRPSESYFPATAYITGAKNYLKQNYPNFEPDFFIMRNFFTLIYGARYTGNKEGYNAMTDIIAVQLSDNNSTPIYLYNPSTGIANITTLQNPSYTDASVFSTTTHSFYAFTYPGEYTADYTEYGIYYDYRSTDTPSYNSSTFRTPTTSLYYEYVSETSQNSVYFNPKTFLHFVNRITLDHYSIYELPVYTLVNGVPKPYDLGLERTIPQPDIVVPPADENALYNNNIVQGKISKNDNEVVPYIDTSGQPVTKAEPVTLPPREIEPEPEPETPFWLQPLINALKDLFEYLFVPSKAKLQAYALEASEIVETNGGLLTYPIELVIRFLTEVSQLGDEDCVFVIPQIKYKQNILYSGTSFNFTEFVEQEEYAEIYDTYIIIVNYIMVIALITLAVRKGDEMLRGS